MCEEAINSFNVYWLASEEKYLLSTLLGILRLSQTFLMDTPALYLLFPLVGEFLRLYATSQ